MTDYLNYSLKPNFKVLGKELGPKIKLLQEELKKVSSIDAAKVATEPLTIKLDGEDFTLDNLNTITSLEVKDGYAASSNNNISVILNTNLTEELILEGLAREFVRKVQSLRKEADFIITDHINIYYSTNETIDKMIDMYKDYIMGETLAEKLEVATNISEKYQLNDLEIEIKVERI